MPATPVRGSRPRIAIVGANFAGLSAAQRLGTQYAVTVIDHSRWFEWRPGIHELVSGVKNAADLRLPRSRLVTRAGQEFLRATVADIDARAGRLTTEDGRQVDFDACIVAVGGVTHTFGVVGAARHALPLKTVDDGVAIGRKLAALARQKGNRSVVIVGGGLEGIEVLGEVLRRYRDRKGLHISMIEAAPRLMPGGPPALDAAIRAHCVDLDVEFRTRSMARTVTRGRVHLRSGESIRSDLTIWTAGATAPAVLLESRLADKANRWAPVTNGLRSRRFDNVFVAGDAATLTAPLVKQAFYAMQMGRFAAENAMRAVAGRRLRVFTPSPKPQLVAFGDLDTFLVSGRSVIASPTLAAAKELVFQVSMARFDPPLQVSSVRALTGRLARSAASSYMPRRR